MRRARSERPHVLRGDAAGCNMRASTSSFRYVSDVLRREEVTTGVMPSVCGARVPQGSCPRRSDARRLVCAAIAEGLARVRAALRDKRREAAITRASELPPTPRGEAFRVVSRVYEPGAGGVFRTADGCVYGVAFDGSIHVARDENGKRLRPPSKRSPFLAPGDTEKPERDEALPRVSPDIVVPPGIPPE